MQAPNLSKKKPSNIFVLIFHLDLVIEAVLDDFFLSSKSKHFLSHIYVIQTCPLSLLTTKNLKLKSYVPPV